MPKLLFARAPIDEREEQRVRRLAAARHAPADWITRAKIITASWDGTRVPAIADMLGIHQKTVRYRLARFDAEGIDGFTDRPGVGRKRRVTEAQRSQIVALIAQPPPGRLVTDTATGELVAVDEHAAGCWTLDTLTATAHDKGIVVQRSQVRRILLAEGRRWRRTRSWVVSTDPEFVPKEPVSSAFTLIHRQVSRSSPPMNSVR